MTEKKMQISFFIGSLLGLLSLLFLNCQGSINRCIFGGGSLSQATFNILVVFGILTIITVLLSENVFVTWVKRFFLGVLFAGIYIFVSPESTNIGDPVPEKEAAIFISAGILFLWSMVYFGYCVYKEKK